MTEKETAAAAPEENLSELLQIRREKLLELRRNGRDPFVETKYQCTSDSRTIKEQFEQMEGQPVSIAGRMMSKRG
ncbi:MAG: lysine--tRNA ligase, partial [Oscillospiraceae bacterium]|nr:lysine--tRNA ligase [Oscillospiraceae bacterium]